jgi:hypothetical protein
LTLSVRTASPTLKRAGACGGRSQGVPLASVGATSAAASGGEVGLGAWSTLEAAISSDVTSPRATSSFSSPLIQTS